jgi:hypothetical protein
MSKPTITKLFVGSLIAIVAGIVLAIVAVIAAAADGAFVMSGPDVVGFNPSPFTGSMLALVVLGGLAIVGGGIGQLVAWIGALLNTARLDDKLWFILLLVLGLLSFGFIAMIVYLIVGPDGTQVPAAPGQVRQSSTPLPQA